MKGFFIVVFVILCSGCSVVNRPEKTLSLLPTEQQRTGVLFTTSAERLNVAPWDIRYQLVGVKQQVHLATYLKLFEEEISKLPKAVLELAGLETVAFVLALQIGTQPRAAVPDYIHEVLYYDIMAIGDDYRRHVIHHEFYHMLEQQVYGSAYFRDPNWLDINPQGFEYGAGGQFARNAEVAVFNNPAPGFINQYAMSGVEEDKAEIWAVIWSKASWDKVLPIVKQDPLVREKVTLLIAQLQCMLPELELTWPDYVTPYLPKANACNRVKNAEAKPITA
ncbi:putative zinc-binding metallopeptidase [Pseudoalteromonas sp. T1lg65]|uniref:putative zinc-binding metallopeptidase n=1 Tax=Pseudoalteromonas sp. T1lg65 TaxID=2077101 RepID=UPI003F7AA760